MHIAAVENEDLLRFVAEGASDSAVLAVKLGRRKDSVIRSLMRLVDVGVLDEVMWANGGPSTYRLTEDGKAALSALDVAAGRAGAIPGYIGLHLKQIMPSALNPRTDFDSDEASEDLSLLMSDILQNGLLQNLVVRRDGETYQLVSGERRWRAIYHLIHDGDLPADYLIPCQLIETDDLGHRLRALAENLQRRALNPMEEARAFKALVDSGLSTADLADRVSVSQRTVQMRLQLLNLSEDDQERLEAGDLTVREARAKVQTPTPLEAAIADRAAPVVAKVAPEPKAEQVTPVDPLNAALEGLERKDREQDQEEKFAQRLLDGQAAFVAFHRQCHSDIDQFEDRLRGGFIDPFSEISRRCFISLLSLCKITTPLHVSSSFPGSTANRLATLAVNILSGTDPATWPLTRERETGSPPTVADADPASDAQDEEAA